MSDPIKKILMQLDKEMAAAVAVGSGKGLGNYDNAIKQIRQQIGGELLSKADLYGDKEGVYTAVKALDIREVCQMEES